MGKLQMCRICLVKNVRMYVVVNRTLHEFYEKLTDIPFVTEDSRPILACFICCTKLKQCCRLLRQCLEAEEQFAQMMNKDYEPNPLIKQDHLKFYSGFIQSPIEHVYIVDECQTESIAIKEELPAVCEGLDDIIEPKEEYQSDELEPENLDNTCLDVADLPPHYSGSDLGYDVPIIEFKTEVEEEVSLDNSCLDVADVPPHYSGSDLGYDVPIIEFKTEVEQDVSKKKRTATEANKIISNVDQNNPIAAVLMDMSKAFDHVHHKILLDRRSDVKKKLKIFTDGGIRKGQGDDEGESDEIKKRRSLQNKMKCRRYREKIKKREEIFSSQTKVELEENIKRRKEYNRQKTQRYRDKKRAIELMNLHTKRQGDDEGAEFSNDGKTQNEIDEIKKRMSLQNKIKCRRYRENKKKRECNHNVNIVQ